PQPPEGPTSCEVGPRLQRLTENRVTGRVFASQPGSEGGLLHRWLVVLAALQSEAAGALGQELLKTCVGQGRENHLDSTAGWCRKVGNQVFGGIPLTPGAVAGGWHRAYPPGHPVGGGVGE